MIAKAFMYCAQFTFVTQKDGCNCGVFALENAHRITEMLNEDKSFDEIDRELSKYKPKPEELQEKRREFAKALMDSTSVHLQCQLHYFDFFIEKYKQ